MDMMRIILLGAPGSGKGTQAKFLTEKYRIPLISTGDILRTEIRVQSKTSKRIQQTITEGQLVTDEIVISLIKKRIKQETYRNGFLLDGFPRTILQAKAIENLNVDFVLELVVPDSLIFDRIAGRRIHVPSGRVYHVISNPPKQEGRDDLTGEKLSIRKDDLANIMRKRLLQYHQYTTPIIDYYHQEAKAGHIHYATIDGTRKITDINAELVNILG